MEYKRTRHFVKTLDEESRTVTGIFAVHGNIDDGGDMSIPGSFARRLEGRSRVRFLWNHNAMNPPIASVLKIREVGREELPPKVLEVAPEATGGVEITRKYYEDVPLADWVYGAVVRGDTEMSYAYDVHGYEMRGEDDKRIRILTDVELFDVSDVNWGMNPATAGVKGNGVFPGTGMTFTEHSLAAAAALEEFLERVEERKSWRERDGRTLSEAVRKRLLKLNGVLESILRATEPLAAAGEVQSLLSEYLNTERLIAEIT